MARKPFTVSSEWINYAHGPGAESGHPIATELCEMTDFRNQIKLTKPEHVREVLSVAELYSSDSSVQDDERLWFRLYPNKLIKRARAWLR